MAGRAMDGAAGGVRLCRGCLCTNKLMSQIDRYAALITELAQIQLSSADGLPEWLCWECAALLEKAVRFRRKLLQSNALLLDYLARCAPFPMEAADRELSCLAAPVLSLTHTLTTEVKKSKGGFLPDLTHEKRFPAVWPVGEDLFAKSEQCDDDVKYEDGTDFEDNITLGEFKELQKQSWPEVDTADAVVKTDSCDLEVKVEPEETRLEEAGEKRRKLKRKEERRGKRGKRAKPPEEPPAKRIRQPLVLDPAKIRTIQLDPAQQLRERAEAAACAGYLRFPFKCQLCFKGFNYETKLHNHMKKHDPARGKFECKLCRMYLPTIYSYNIHTLTHTTRYECLQCGKQMTDRGCIAEHYEAQHEGRLQHFTCHMCGKTSSNYRTHRGHMRNHHSGERPRCEQCGKTFVNKDSLAEHTLIHAGVKSHTCGACDARFRTKTQLKHHQLKHTSVRQFYCVECDVRFKSAHNLRQHLNKSKRHIDPDLLKFGCSRCPRRFDSSRSLEHHVSFGHEGRRLYACSVCGAQLATRNSLAKHTRVTHQGYKAPLKHVCDTCGKAFRGKNVLVNHVRTHTGEKPYECADCGRKFSQRTAMRTHVKLVHLKVKRNTKQKDIPTIHLPVIKMFDTAVPKEEVQVFDNWERPQVQEAEVYFISGT